MKNLEKYFQAKSAYYIGEPIMSDSAFDALELELSKTNPEILKHVGASERSGKEKLPLLMGSLDQLRNEKEWSNWKSKFHRASEFIFTEKIDGNSCLLEYRNGILVNSWSRGDGVYGASNIRHTARMENIPQYVGDSFTGYIRGELVVAKKDWETLLTESVKEYANARNFVAGFLNSTIGQPELYKFFKFIAFELFSVTPLSKLDQFDVLSSYKFLIPNLYSQDRRFAYSDVENMITGMIEKSFYEIDGVVVDIGETQYRKFSATVDDLNPSYSVKIKLINSSVDTGVLGVEWSVSKDGLMKPVVLIEPIVLTGVTVSRVTGYNAKFIVDNGIGIGAIVSVIRSGDVIPKIVGVPSTGEVTLPEGEWNDSEVDLLSTSSEGATQQKAKQIQYFFAKMEIDFIGEGAVAKLMAAGYNDITEIIIEPKILEKVIGENGRKASVIMSKILSETTPQRLFAALGSFGRGMGERKLKVVFDSHPLTNVLSGKVPVYDYCEMAGFDVKTAEFIYKNSHNARNVYEKIRDKVNFVQEKAVALGTGIFSNQIIVATGVRLNDDIIQKIQSKGGIVADSFNKQTTLLVAKDPKSSSGKAQKARDLDIKVISLDELVGML